MNASGARCWAEIDLRALRHNMLQVIKLVGPDVGVMAIVKADAYGHGVGPVVRELNSFVEMFGVANLAEAREVRTIAPDVEILILGPALPGERLEILRAGFIPSISNLEEARAFNSIGEFVPPPPSLPHRSTTAARSVRAGHGRAPVHVTIDTGMGRMGVWEEDAQAMIRQIRNLPHIEITGVATHLPSADEDPAFTRAQLRRFEELVRTIMIEGNKNIHAHALNSAGIINFTKFGFSLVRPGLMLYGCSPVPNFQKFLQPAMTVKTRVTLVRDVAAGRSISYGRTFITDRPMRVATLSIGYADGYPRRLSNQGTDVLVHGQRCPLLGRVTMDHIIVDVGSVRGIDVGDEVVLMGRQGDTEISALELAQKAGTIMWEILTGLHGRLQRFQIGDHAEARQFRIAKRRRKKDS